MVIAPGADDCQVWNSDIGSYSMGVAVVKADDLHISARQQDKWHSMLWISRGPRQKEKNVHVLWGPFQDDLLELMPGADMQPGVGGYRSDAYSVFEGTAGPDGKGMYYKGYAKKVEQTLHTVRGATTVHAWDPSLFLDKAGHDRLVALAERGGDPSMLGRHGRGALERIPYFDPMRAYAHPYGHAKLYGVVKRTLKLFLGKLKGMWTIEDFLNFVLYYAPLVFGDLLLTWNVRMDRAWQCLRRAVLYYVRGRGLPGDTTEDERRQARDQARADMLEHAVIMEEDGPLKMLTYNLRLMVVHLSRQENHLGLVLRALEFWVERGVQRAKGKVSDRNVKNRPVEAIMAVLCDNAAVEAYKRKRPNFRHIEDMVMKLWQPPDQGDTDAAAPTAPCYFLGTGCSLHTSNCSQVLPAHIQSQYETLLTETGHVVSDVNIKAFLRMSLNEEVVTSAMYPRMVVRLSHFVSIADNSLAGHSQRMPTGYEHAQVICYFLVTDAESDDVILRLARIRVYKTVEDEYHGNLGVTLLARDNTMDLLVPCSTILTKVLWYDHPACNCIQAMHLCHQVRTGAY
ncbi:hypothetical protein CYMTET_43084 [Cymbomonas tetramitiformis]|uniref:Uncharacterized protein n=1 Tax=Cymbomonas tetramitiformis TaxID=36881 RepID=A0AAE0F0C2_9CHLO|nr:hypothetical protein CYMTET_43084 [Cymbomonas tetramitiformis]